MCHLVANLLQMKLLFGQAIYWQWKFALEFRNICTKDVQLLDNILCQLKNWLLYTRKCNKNDNLDAKKLNHRTPIKNDLFQKKLISCSKVLSFDSELSVELHKPTRQTTLMNIWKNLSTLKAKSLPRTGKEALLKLMYVKM